MAKIAFIGAGSVTFARRILTDILTWPEHCESSLALMDIDGETLEITSQFVQRLIREQGLGATVSATVDRREALAGADYVITAIDVGGQPLRMRDWQIPAQYGVHQTVADTIGPGGVFRGLRTAPVLASIAQDMEALCPDALLINYANPMNINMWLIGATSNIRAVGLCHSVQGTAGQLATYMGLRPEEVSYWVAGINHQAWFLQLCRDSYRGEDLYPRLRAAMDDPEIYAKDSVRFEVLRHFSYFVTESSHHMSEYTPWFRRTAADRARFVSENLKRWAEENNIERDSSGNFIDDEALIRESFMYARQERREDYFASQRSQLESSEPLPFKRTHEYCSFILHAVETDTPYRFNGNVPNTGLITNLPAGCNVEVPILVDSAGLHPCHVGDLPAQCAGINRTNVNVQELTVQAMVEQDRRRVHEAIALDPLTTTQCSLDDVRAMTEALFAASAEHLTI
jgi:alpha-galactosidase